MPRHDARLAAIDQAAQVAAFEWTDDQTAVMARADRLHAYGAADAPADLVARSCVIPSSISTSHVHRAVRLDVRRWYRAFTGTEWNGNLDELHRARERAGRMRRSPVRPAINPGPANDVPADGARRGRPRASRNVLRSFRTCHLLVEPLDDHPHLHELRDFTRFVGWPSPYNAGFLDWSNDDAVCCAFCGALLLPSEAKSIPGSIGAVCGKHCCAEG